ncbi:MAG: cyclic nucleotide-binding/CBS domain-containing protein [Syntrophobacteraceae bacterium]
MPVAIGRDILKGLLVEEAMRRQVVRAPHDTSLDNCAGRLIKYKVNALLIDDEGGSSVGVVSKTDIVGAFYGGLPIAETVSGDIMNGPVLTCFPDDELGVALDLMRQNGTHQLFVQGAEVSAVIGTLSYADVVALLYRFCRACPRGAAGRSEAAGLEDSTQVLRVREAMRTWVLSCRKQDSLAVVIEELTARRLGAVLVKDRTGLPVGVISKTDIVLAYRHGASLDVEAQSVMKAPPVFCEENALLTDAIRRMFLSDVQRLFVHGADPSQIVGVLSLADAAQLRSGSCKACMASRMIADP